MKNLLIVLSLFLSSWTIAQTFSASQSVLISWKGEWFPGKIIEVKEEGYLVSYDNYDASWNEIVSVDRLKSIENNTSSEAPKEQTDVTKSTPTSTTPSSTTLEAKVKEMCDCQQYAEKTGKIGDRERCFDMKDAHLASFEQGGEDYYNYKRLIFECKQEALNVTTAPEGSFEKYKKEVCDCFEKNKSNKSAIMNCYKLQNDYSNQMGSEEERVKFIQETNSCIKSN